MGVEDQEDHLAHMQLSQESSVVVRAVHRRRAVRASKQEYTYKRGLYITKVVPGYEATIC